MENGNPLKGCICAIRRQIGSSSPDPPLSPIHPPKKSDLEHRRIQSPAPKERIAVGCLPSEKSMERVKRQHNTKRGDARSNPDGWEKENEKKAPQKR
uniref:Uncharacterized protein n=1 Tax=Panagrellus redivivus TaxID=6233 RepID=A0A7E4UV33_PANRE